MPLKLNNDELKNKGKGYAYGIKQNNWQSKEDTSSPTVSTEGRVLTCMIENMDGRDVATDYITGDLLQTD